MATAVKKTSSPLPPPELIAKSPLPLRWAMAVYRFLASVKLAVLSIGSLAAVLAYATWYERNHGTVAVRQDIYEAPFFSILLAFLAINIFCAATIRYPWTKRQTGFLVTHIGLLVLIGGSWYGFHYSDEGQVGAVEGSTMSELVRTEKPMIRLRELSPTTGQPIDPEYVIPFQGGAFDWPAGKYQQISKKNDPFKLAVKNYYAASIPKIRHFADPSGSPMLRILPLIKAPGQKEATNVFESESQQWLTIPADIRLSRVSRPVPPARMVFYYVDRPEIVEDFLKPPADPGTMGAVRFHYNGKDGKRLAFDLKVDSLKKDQTVALPDSDLKVTYLDRKSIPVEDPTILESLGEPQLTFVEFNVQLGQAAPVKHTAFASLPMIPSVIPSPNANPAEPPRSLVDMNYYQPPQVTVGGGMAGTFGIIEVMGDAQGKLYYRVFGRDKTASTAKGPEERPSVLRAGPAPLPIGQSVMAFGGEGMPMTLTFSAEAYFPKGKAERIYESFEMPIGKKGNGLAAAELELTVDDVTRDFWVQRPISLSPSFRPISVGKRMFEVAFDFDRKDLGFSLFLKKFIVDFDPGTQQASSFTSEVTLTDEKNGVKDRPITIWMNNPLTHREYTFYQSSYERMTDPESGRETGEFKSILQVGHDAGRPLKYLGSLLIVLGTFLQFYMRAGLFSTSAKQMGANAADRARERLAKLSAKPADAAEAPAHGKAKKPKRSADEDIL